MNLKATQAPMRRQDCNHQIMFVVIWRLTGTYWADIYSGHHHLVSGNFIKAVQEVNIEETGMITRFAEVCPIMDSHH